MKRYLCYLLIVILTQNSCSDLSKDEKVKAKYDACNKYFDTLLTNYLPSKIPNSTFSFGCLMPSKFDSNNKYAGVYFVTKYNDYDEYLRIKELYSNHAKIITKSTDSCFFIINTYGIIKDSKLDTITCKNPVPIPQFGIHVAKQNINAWEKDTLEKVIVMNYHFEFYQKDTLKQTDSDLCSKQTTGYSVGITINDRHLTVRYWLIKWENCFNS